MITAVDTSVLLDVFLADEQHGPSSKQRLRSGYDRGVLIICDVVYAELESDLVERKETAADGRKIRRNICAFANDLPGHGRPGVVLVGVTVRAVP